MKPHPITRHDIGADAPLSAPLEEFEAGANREHVLRIIIADQDGCRVHIEQLLRLVANNLGSATLALGLALTKVRREWGVEGVSVVRRLPIMRMILDNITDAAEADADLGTAMRNTLGAMAPNMRRRVVAAAIAILNAPSARHLM